MNWNFWGLVLLGALPIAGVWIWLEDKRPHWSTARQALVVAPVAFLWAAFAAWLTR